MSAIQISRHRRYRRLAGTALVAGFALLAAACGSSATVSGGGDPGSSDASSSVGVKAAAAFLKAAEQHPTSMNLPRTSKAIPSGETVSFVNCGVAVCDTIAQALKNATSVLGWKLDVIPSDGTPAGVKAAWDAVVRLHPAVAIGSGFDHTMFASEALQLEAMHVPVLNWTTTDTVGAGITFVKGGPNNVHPAGSDMAAYIVANSGDKANTLYVNVPSFVILQPVMTTFESYYKKWCPGCGLSTLSMPLSAIGTSAPSMIVSYLRAHPQINNVAVSYDGAGVGLPAALAAAGLNGKVTYVGNAPTATNVAYVQAGTEAATVAEPYYEIFAMFMDAAARLVTGQSLAPDVAWQNPFFVVTKANVAGGAGFSPVLPDLNAQLAKLWKK
jgi:ABC-type sugar transport system substrate-binding protein